MIKNNFDKGPEGWCSYDYHASIVADGSNIFILATWAAQGGVDNESFIWTDHRRWSADTPERPLSILPLLCYRSWVGADPLDMRQSAVAVHLRADRLCLDGAQCFFWVHAASTRWHYTAHPLALAEGVWTANRLALAADENQWHRSWSADPGHPVALEQVLSRAESYGFSFVGFSSEVTGRLSMSQFSITAGT
ncbi:MAG: hypothetical protein F4Z57_07975 [Gemmatimonadetes bacterium]|nr:hypothetical protein [Gemmatimonadota bacterium]MXW78910.1 hypothetical protein [Gemmatimonadota bacterium]MYC70054.1 hypothetical protein [Gemmatimonadota bacterium]MYI62149.1 hypothetical protein [Gemmatimonadota bacterium]